MWGFCNCRGATREALGLWPEEVSPKEECERSKALFADGMFQIAIGGPMKRILAVFTLLFALSCLAACSSGGRSPIAEAIATPGADWLTYTNNGYGFQLLYPRAKVGVPTGTVSFTHIFLPFALGTNLQNKDLAIYVQVGSPTCQSTLDQFTNPAAAKTNLSINGLHWVNQALGGAPLGATSDWSGYSTASRGVCVSLVFTLTFFNPASGTGPPAYNKAAESQVFLQIVSTFKWLSGGAVTPTP